MNHHSFFTVALAVVASIFMTVTVFAGDTKSAPGAKVYFINIKDGDTIKSPALIQFGLSGMGIAPAGTEKENTGHHHLFIDRSPIGEGDDGKEEFNAAIPADDNHKHYGGGQTETMLELPKGKHTLQMVLGDKDHIPHDPLVFSQVITVMVE